MEIIDDIINMVGLTGHGKMAAIIKNVFILIDNVVYQLTFVHLVPRGGNENNA